MDSKNPVSSTVYISGTRKYMHAETLALLTKPLYFPYVVQLSHYILRFKMFSRFKFVQMTTTSHCYITLRDTSLKFFSFSVVSKTSSSFSSPHFGQLACYSGTYNNGRFSLEGKLYFDIYWNLRLDNDIEINVIIL
jgi:hypothetical protein